MNFKPHPSPHDYGILSMEDIGFWENTLQRVAMDFGEVVMLELGVANGGTTIGTKRHCDKMGWPFRWVGLDMTCGRPTFDLGDWGSFVEGDIQSPENNAQVPENTFNLLLVDSCHCRFCCTADFLGYNSKVVVGGYVSFHDSNPDPNWALHHEQCRPDRFIDVRGALADLKLLPCTRPDYQFIGEQANGKTQGMYLIQKLAML